MNHLQTIVIIGGGISGSLTAFHLCRLGVRSRVVVVDPAPEIGLGLAYSTPSMEHLLNVPAGKMTLLPDDPDHFLEWLQANYDPAMTAERFAPRAIFGQYMQSLLKGVSGIEHVRATVLDCQRMDGKAMLTISGGQRILADIVVLATGNFLPAMLPGISQAVTSSGGYCHSAWDERTYTGLSPDAPVILIGTGLTGVDVLLRLRQLGHRGPVKMVSRHGVLPHPHAPYSPLEKCVIEGEPPKHARELLRHVHRALKSGLPWRAVVDSLRSRTNEFWLALPPAEQRRFKRHLQRRWEVARHRMAPSIAERIHKELAAQTLEVVSGSVLSMDVCDSGAKLVTRAKDGSTRVWHAARIINCTGPNLDYTRVGSELLNSLFARGEIMAGPMGYGLWSNAQGALRALNGTYSKILFNVGPGRQGVLFESIAVPELRQQAVELAEFLSAELERFSPERETASHDPASPELSVSTRVR